MYIHIHIHIIMLTPGAQEALRLHGGAAFGPLIP